VASLDILWPAFLTGMLVLATHVPLGQFVLDRGIVFIDLAIAQAAGLGVVVGDALGVPPQGLQAQLAAGTAALLAAGFLVWTERRVARLQEAIIGVVFVLAASVEILVLSFHPHGAEHLRELLIGQILWVEPRQLLSMLAVSLLVLAIWRRGDLARRRAAFYLLFALAVTASVQLVGVFLVFASLILPALAVQRRPAAARLWPAYGIGVAGYALGLGASAWADLPAGGIL